MAYVCPYCGGVVEEDTRCSICNHELSWVKKIHEKSNSYYNKGYYEAIEGNLTTASTYLKKAVYYNKYNMKARNLLGLIYFEMGKIGSALKEWIISLSLVKNDNLAEEYINKIQNSPKQLVTYKESIGLYNKALMYLKKNNNDMAVIRLKKAVGLNGNFVEARNLLALCYIKEKQFYKANEQIKNSLAIDRSNLKALSYFRTLSKEDTGSAQPYELEFIPKRSKSNYVKPSKVINRGHILAAYVLYFIIGGLGMFMIQTSLILPSKTKGYQNEIIKLKDSEKKLSHLLVETREQSKSELTQLEEKNQRLILEKKDIELATSKMAQREKLAQATNLKNSNEWVQTAEVLYNVAPSLLDGEYTAIYEALKKEVYPRAAKILCDEGYRDLNGGDLVNSKTKLEKAIVYEPAPDLLRKSLYYLGLVEKAQGNTDKAKYYFNTVVEQHAGTNEAKRSTQELNSLV